MKLTARQTKLLEPVGMMHLEQMKRLQLSLEIQKVFGAKAANKADALMKNEKVGHPKFDKQAFLNKLMQA